jgi:hypothetical protein
MLDELALAAVDCQHRAGPASYDMLRDAPEQETLDAAAAVRAHRNQIDRVLKRPSVRLSRASGRRSLWRASRSRST